MQEAIIDSLEQKLAHTQQLSEENARLQLALEQARQDYAERSDRPTPKTAVSEVEQDYTQQSRELTAKLKMQEAIIDSLEQKIAHTQQLSEENARLRLTLQQARQDYAEMSRRLNELTQTPQASPKEKIVHEYKPAADRAKQIERLRQKIAVSERSSRQRLILSKGKERKTLTVFGLISEIDQFIVKHFW